jgi:hypothetical protein
MRADADSRDTEDEATTLPVTTATAGVGRDPSADERTGDTAPRSPAEVFAELAQQVEHLRRELALVSDFVRGSHSHLARSTDELLFEGAEAAIRGLIRVDELLYRHVRETGRSARTDEFRALASLLDGAIDGELRSLGVTRSEPQVGEEPDLSRTVTIANRPTPIGRPWLRGRIAAVTSRGYILTTGDRTRLLKKSEVVIHRSRTEPAIELTEEQREEPPRDRD